MTPIEFQETIKQFLIENGTVATFDAFASVIETSRSQVRASGMFGRFDRAARLIRDASSVMMGGTPLTGE